VQKSYFANREFSFTLASDTYIRFQSFSDADEWKKELLRMNPVKIDIGAVYNIKVMVYLSLTKIRYRWIHLTQVRSQKKKRVFKLLHLFQKKGNWFLILI
jgi:hypothetical protein